MAHVTAGCGEAGTRWIENLESTVQRLEHHWDLRVEKPFAAGEFNFVAPATTTDGGPVVVKIAPPWDPVEIFGEAEYLRYREGVGCVRLLGVEPHERAILMERIFPGENFAAHFDTRKQDAIGPAIGALRAVLRPEPNGPHSITSLDKWFDGLRRYKTTDFPQHYAAKALKIYDRLSGGQGEGFYLHGDFHHGNLVTSNRSEFVVIDPKGITGHVGYEIAVFLNNHHWWQETDPNIDAILIDAVRRFSEAFGIDESELRQWAYAQMVLGSWWNYVDMPELYDGGVVKADIWRV
ncbi:MAG TPA: aminoglycoside phosphotransferase family protein [Pyrinomonadaceae bacterium]|nr:aminoglycoside phosphotransferase family protein [Pyrinomonadaceae bacterium]